MEILTPNSIGSQDVRLESSWKTLLLEEFQKPYMIELKKFLQKEIAQKKVIYPPGKEIFNALNTTPFDQVRVVIIGQDPYHGPGQAHGLCFSVKIGVQKPPSLLNIFKEIERDLKIKMPEHGDLSGWASQGVLLLNATLTVESGQAGSHQNRGWEEFTDKVIEKINECKKNVIFLLWGSYAQKKGQIIDRNKHLVLEAPHPSPLSAHRGFIGCNHFSTTNKYLKAHNLSEIRW